VTRNLLFIVDGKTGSIAAFYGNGVLPDVRALRAFKCAETAAESVRALRTPQVIMGTDMGDYGEKPLWHAYPYGGCNIEVCEFVTIAEYHPGESWSPLIDAFGAPLEDVENDDVDTLKPPPVKPEDLLGLAEEDRQFVLLSLALCSLLRPGFHFAAGNIAQKFFGREMFEQFREYNRDTVNPEPGLPL